MVWNADEDLMSSAVDRLALLREKIKPMEKEADALRAMLLENWPSDTPNIEGSSYRATIRTIIYRKPNSAQMRLSVWEDGQSVFDAFSDEVIQRQVITDSK